MRQQNIFDQKFVMKNFSKKLFSRKWFRKKIFGLKNVSWIFFLWTYPRGNDFATIQNFRPKNFFTKIFGMNLFSRKWFCNHKNFRPKNVSWKFLVLTYFRGNDFATINIFDQKMFHENFWYEPIFEEMILQP